MTYRLAPAYGWPSGSDDVANAVRFVRANCQEFNADSNAIFIMGQSAGAAHVAGYLAHPQYEASSAIAGAILMSGMYDLTELGITPMQATYFGNDTAQHAARSTVKGLTANDCTLSIFDRRIRSGSLSTANRTNHEGSLKSLRATASSSVLCRTQSHLAGNGNRRRRRHRRSHHCRFYRAPNSLVMRTHR